MDAPAAAELPFGIIVRRVKAEGGVDAVGVSICGALCPGDQSVHASAVVTRAQARALADWILREAAAIDGLEPATIEGAFASDQAAYL